MRVPIAPEKALQPQHIAVTGAADDHRSAGAGLEKVDATQDERAHDALAQVGFAHHDVAQAVRRYDEGLDRALGAGVDQRRAAGELRQLAHERALAVRDDRPAAGEFVPLRYDDLAGEDDDHAQADGAGGRQIVVRAVGPRLAEAAQPLDVGGRQGREHLVAAGLDKRTRRCGHCSTSGRTDVRCRGDLPVQENATDCKFGVRIRRLAADRSPVRCTTPQISCVTPTKVAIGFTHFCGAAVRPSTGSG